MLEVRLMFMLISSWVDQLGNLHGRVEGMNASAEALLIGSHLVMLSFFPYFLIEYYFAYKYINTRPHTENMPRRHISSILIWDIPSL